MGEILTAPAPGYNNQNLMSNLRYWICDVSVVCRRPVNISIMIWSMC